MGFDELGLTEIVAFTAVANSRSRAVMERLGMARRAASAARASRRSRSSSLTVVHRVEVFMYPVSRSTSHASNEIQTYEPCDMIM